MATMAPNHLIHFAELPSIFANSKQSLTTPETEGHSCCIPLAGSSLDDYMQQDTGLCLTLTVAYSIGNETCLWHFL